MRTGREALREFACSGLANYKVPKEVVVLDALPILPNEKVDRQELRRRASAAFAARKDAVETAPTQA